MDSPSEIQSWIEALGPWGTVVVFGVWFWVNTRKNGSHTDKIVGKLDEVKEVFALKMDHHTENLKRVENTLAEHDRWSRSAKK